MKVNKIIAGAAILAAGAVATAQSVSFHGYNDYTFFGAAQKITQSTDGTWTASDVYADEGSWYNGRTEINASVSASNFQFNLGVRLNSSLGSWYSLYSDQVASATTNFHQGNMKVSFLNNQLGVYLGKFEEWNLDYVYNGYMLGGQDILELASRDVGQHFTAAELTPYAVQGLKVLVGVPIIPADGNGTSFTTDYNNWKYLWRTAKIAAQYKIQPINTTLNFSYRPGLYCTSYTYTTAENFSTSSVVGEAYLQADMPTLIPGFKMNATYDFRYRYNSTTDTWPMAHRLAISGQLNPMQGLTINLENRVGYAGAHFVKTNEIAFQDKFGAGVTYNIPGTQWVAGFTMIGSFAQDSTGSAFSSGAMSSEGRTYWDLSVDGLTFASNPTSGSTTRYFGIYGFPSITKNFSNGYFKTGVEAQYSRAASTDSTSTVAWRVPFMFCFWY